MYSNNKLSFYNGIQIALCAIGFLSHNANKRARAFFKYVRANSDNFIVVYSEWNNIVHLHTANGRLLKNMAYMCKPVVWFFKNSFKWSSLLRLCKPRWVMRGTSTRYLTNWSNGQVWYFPFKYRTCITTLLRKW